MPDREKVIKGLTCCIDGGAEACLECPYCAVLNVDSFGKTEWRCRDLRKEALQLLKDQAAAADHRRDAIIGVRDPRLVTKADFHSDLAGDGGEIPCWKESKSPTRRSGWAVIVYGKMYQDVKGGIARYWTARPTDAQREETPWTT